MATNKWLYSHEKLDKKEEEFSSIFIKLASADKVRLWSYGEVNKPETINYRTYKPEFDGLFCEKIFGPVKDYECACGKYKRVRYKGVVCDRCGVEVTHHKVRRERMGHIELAVPVVHIWYYSSLPSTVAHLLDITNKSLEKIIYYENYVVVEGDGKDINEGDLLSEEDYFDYLEEGKVFKALIGGEAVKYLLEQLDLEDIAADLRRRIKEEVSEPKKIKMLARLKIVDKLRQSGNLPTDVVYDAIPVIPPDLRPLVPLEGGRFASSDLNDLYRRVINRNNRLKKLLEIEAPKVILKNEKRMLQEAVDSLFDNGRRKFVLKGEGRRPIKSLSDMLKGKKGRFRQNLLGKRVDYSGRSVIVVGPELKIFEVGIPKVMALELFKPFVIAKLEKRGIVHSIKTAKKMIADESAEVWDILEEIIEDHPVLLNRAPTLHRVSIQAFYVKLTDGFAIRLSPFVCAAFNADFDGDQMAVHVPLSFEAQLEARVLMLSSRNTLSPASGRSLAVPSQDTVMGNYFLTKFRAGDKGEGKRFSSFEEATFAYETGVISLFAEIYMPYKGENIKTTYGRFVFNRIVPEGVEYQNKVMDKKALASLTFDVYTTQKHSTYIKFLDDLKDIGFKWATKSGISIGIDDVIIPDSKYTLVEKSLAKVKEVRDNYEMGFITDRERYSSIIDIWTHASNKVAGELMDELKKSKDGFNALYMMADSGARGSKEQIRQLAGMRGLMAKPKKAGEEGDVVETPITSNFKEGLDILEYYISSHGARKGLADTALKTADAGYLTRRLVDVAQDLIVSEKDCGTIKGIAIEAVKHGEDVIVPLAERIRGRYPLEDVKDPLTGEILAEEGELITDEQADEIEKRDVVSVMVRSVLTCDSKIGCCQKCYGTFPANDKIVDIGTAVGVVASQSIGEPGTQLTLRTFHIGGAATRIAAEKFIKTTEGGKVSIVEVESLTLETGKELVLNRNGELIVTNEEGKKVFSVEMPIGAILEVKDGDVVKKDDIIFEWDPYNLPIQTDFAGTVKYNNFVLNDSYEEERDDATAGVDRIILLSNDFHPYVEIIDANGEIVKTMAMPVGARMDVEDGAKVKAGDAIAKLPRQSGQSTDITGGLPRVAELFEVKKPTELAVISESDGVVHIGEIKRNKRMVFVTDSEGVEYEYKIPAHKHILVLDGHKVKSGEKLCEGSVSPHDILRVKGASAVHNYLLNEIQDVYRLQGVSINDKHIESILRQMMRKVKVVNDGDSEFLVNDLVDKQEVMRENQRILEEGGQPCEFEPVLLGITKTALTTESFISAASFQETTRVLTNAAVSGKIDTLDGLKENVIIGRLVPAGTGNKHYSKIKIIDEREEEVNISYEDSDLTF